MDAPDTSYYYHDHSDHDDAQNPDSRRCSVRGCLQPLPEGHQNKMCETCRGRHRIYASTKRAKRKLEKAAIANVAARNGANPLILAHGNNLQNQPSASQQTWCALDTQYQVCAPTLLGLWKVFSSAYLRSLCWLFLCSWPTHLARFQWNESSFSGLCGEVQT